MRMEKSERLAGTALLRDFMSSVSFSSSEWAVTEYSSSVVWKHRLNYFVLRLTISRFTLTIDMDGVHEKRLRSVRIKGKQARETAKRFLTSPREVLDEHLALRAA